MSALLADIQQGLPYAGFVILALVGTALAVSEFHPAITRDTTRTAHGSARWARAIEAWRAGLFSGRGLVLGRWRGLVFNPLIRLRTEKHLLTIAPTRAGKGVGTIIPNLLTCPGSAFVIDPKGENAIVTAARRKAMGQKIYVLDPWGITGFPQAAFNPLDRLDPCSPDLAEDAALVAEALIPDKPGTASEEFWEEEAKALLTGLLFYLVAHEPREMRTLTRLRELLTLDKAAFCALLDFMSASDAVGGLVARAANRLKQKPERERASVLSSAQAHTHFLDSPRLKATLAQSDFAPLDLKRERITVYLVLPASRLHSHARWLRLIVNSILSALADQPSRPEQPVLFILDEFPALVPLHRDYDSLTG